MYVKIYIKKSAVIIFSNEVASISGEMKIFQGLQVTVILASNLVIMVHGLYMFIRNMNISTVARRIVSVLHPTW